MKLTNYQTKAARKILVYGAPKTGKTEFVGALAAKKRLWWLDMEDGIKTLLRPESSAAKHLDSIELIRLPDTQLFPIAIETVLKIIKGGACKVCHKHGKVGCGICLKEAPTEFTTIDVNSFTNDDVLVLDSVSQLSVSTMNFICKDQILKGNDDYKPDWDDWRKQGFLLDRIFSIVQQANFNVVAISHEQLVEMEDGKKKLVPIGGTSNFSKTFAKYFDDVVYAEVLNRKYRFYTAASQAPSAVVGSRRGLEFKEGDSICSLFE